MLIARVFPRRTKATPTDELSFSLNRHNGIPIWKSAMPRMDMPEFDEIHISVAFTYDLANAEYLAEQWRVVGVPIRMGGPAFGAPGGEFTPGLYLKPGYVITSRGCPNRCWYCSVWRREGALREYPVADGWNVLDDNLLRCGEAHIREVFAMLKRQPERPVLSGGLEAQTLEAWHVDLMRETAVKHMFFAYDRPDAYEPLVEAGKLLRAGGITQKSHAAGCYVLIGFEGDTFEAADKRLIQTVQAGFKPYAMLYRGEDGATDIKWRDFQSSWIVPEIVSAKMKQYWRPKAI